MEPMLQGVLPGQQEVVGGERCRIPEELSLQCHRCQIPNVAQSDDTVTNETVIMGPNNLLAKLKASFMADHPLYVRRYHFHEYRQAKGQSFPDWWNAKKLTAQECELERVRKDDVMLMELICGVADEKPRNEFLKTDDPTVRTAWCDIEACGMGRKPCRISAAF